VTGSNNADIVALQKIQALFHLLIRSRASEFHALDQLEGIALPVLSKDMVGMIYHSNDRDRDLAWFA